MRQSEFIHVKILQQKNGVFWGLCRGLGGVLVGCWAVLGGLGGVGGVLGGLGEMLLSGALQMLLGFFVFACAGKASYLLAPEMLSTNYCSFRLLLHICLG